MIEITNWFNTYNKIAPVDKQIQMMTWDSGIDIWFEFDAQNKTKFLYEDENDKYVDRDYEVVKYLKSLVFEYSKTSEELKDLLTKDDKETLFNVSLEELD